MGKKEEFRNNLVVKKWDEFSQEKAAQVYLDAFNKNNKKYMLSNAKQRQFYHMLVAAIMLEYHSHFSGYNVEADYRFKSPKSVQEKVVDYLSRGDSSTLKYDEKKQTYIADIKEIQDAFAMKLIVTNRPSTFHAKDPEINQLVQEKVKNQDLLSEMQQFKNQLIDDDFSMEPEYIYNVSKKEYYQKCLNLIDAIIPMLAPEATSLKKYYLDLKHNFEDTMVLIDEVYDEGEIVDKTDYPVETPDFLTLLDDFSLRIYDKLDLAILTKQVESMFQTSSTLKDFGVSLSGIKKKRTPSGYVSNFMYIKTKYGTFELQLQSEHEFREGNYGYAAHSSNMKGKKISRYKIPSLDDKAAVAQFKSMTRYISPRSYVSRMDDVEKNKVITEAYSPYKNYRNIIGQVQENSAQKAASYKYYDKLYSNRKKLFEPNAPTHEIVYNDIEKYIKELNSKQTDDENVK